MTLGVPVGGEEIEALMNGYKTMAVASAESQEGKVLLARVKRVVVYESCIQTLPTHK